MARKKIIDIPEFVEANNISTRLGESSHFIGSLEFVNPLQINGHFEGEIISKGILLIGEQAYVKANIQAGGILISGHVIGNIEASKRVEILPTAKVQGNIRTPKLQIADGVVFDGNCEMIHLEP